MTTYTVSFARIQQMLEDMRRVDIQIRQMLDSLELESNRSLGDWQSEARTAYQFSKQRWDSAATRMAAQLISAQRALAEIMVAYQSAEKQGSGMWQGTRG
ncbi:WXG100 family type VII secretion target [Krasilnikovia sp. M28-CT-15]|uniref:WXG100 family type VII secretion target n=1 Tax=Krasilnikovia sp. M28-CT-15 TaxID=3373540 RepID=UPI003876E697